MPDSPARATQELGICLGLGLAYQISRGPTSPESGEYYNRALTLSRTLPDRGRERFLAAWGVWFFTTMTGRTKEAVARAEDLVAIARELKDSDLLMEAFHARVPGLLRTAEFRAMKESAEEVIRLYDRERHRDHAYYFGGHDSRVCARAFHAVSLWALGLPDQARAEAFACAEDARALGHAFSIAHSLNMGGLTHLLLNDVDACRAITDELLPLAERNKFPWPLTYARFQHGWVTSKTGDREAGIAEMLKAMESVPAAVLQPVVLTMAAEQQLANGQADAAMVTLDQAVDQMQVQHNYFFELEITRLRGEVLLAQSRDNAAEAERIFRHAIDIANKQPCRMIELRSAVSLARLLAERGDKAEARNVLVPVYAAFTEGFNQPDLLAAKAMLAELG